MSVSKSASKRAQGAFLTEVARNEIMRRQQRDALRKSARAWKDEDHPELQQGSDAWVRQMRAESDERFKRIQQHLCGAHSRVVIS